ncbi:Fic family protein [Bradyrhizobium sp. PRIMUS42]|uniref:Fic family protein n=1 Tax=Bradyrhizobium sp. PRIMUS42 TaxID=2908926 RepID=UPI002867CAB7|nr:Fic family protein [Bradyrhizobium sp. PRIMUS42]
MSKQGSPFCFPENIDARAAKLFEELKTDHSLKDLPVTEFAAKAAHFLAELNVIHAFREGNGRSQLSFFAMLAERGAICSIWKGSTLAPCSMP